MWGASGRTLLAHLRPEEIAQVIAICDEKDAHGRTLDEAELHASLEAIRANGYANTFSHRVLHSVGVAVPFLDVHGEVVGTISFQIPEFRFDADRVPELVNALRHTAAVISQRIGATTQT